jgi:hypothetical protein
MKKTITFGAIIVLMGALVTFFVGGFQSGKPAPVTPEQMPINATQGIYGVANTSAFRPVWSVQVVWYRSGAIYGDHVGPFTIQLQYPTKPTKADVQKYVPQPAGLPGKWEVREIYNVVQVGGVQQPIEQPIR